MALTNLQRRALEALAVEHASVNTESLLAQLDVSHEDFLLAIDPLAKRGYVLAVITSFTGGWEITPCGRDRLRK